MGKGLKNIFQYTPVGALLTRKDKAGDAQEAAMQAQIDAMRASAEAAQSVQVAQSAEATQVSASENEAINAENEETRKKRRYGLSATVNNSRLLGAMQGKTVLGG